MGADSIVLGAQGELGPIDPIMTLQRMVPSRDGQHTVENVPQALKVEAAHYFGSLEKAMAALKKQRNWLPGWNRRKIMTVLSGMHRAKESLAYGRMRREVPAVVSAAEAHFGSWGKALYAAGIDPNLYFVHHKWRKGRMSDFIAGVPRDKR
jgi:hypothetical protein